MCRCWSRTTRKGRVYENATRCTRTLLLCYVQECCYVRVRYENATQIEVAASNDEESEGDGIRNLSNTFSWQADSKLSSHRSCNPNGSTHPSYDSANSSALQATAARGAYEWVVVNDTTDLSEGLPVINDTTNLSEGLPVINDTTDLSEGLPVINDTTDLSERLPVINDTTDLSEGLPVINNTSTMTTWVKGCQLLTIWPTWVKSYQLSTIRPTWVKGYQLLMIRPTWVKGCQLSTIWPT